MGNFGSPGGTIAVVGNDGAIAPHVIKAMQRRAQSGGNVSRMIQAPFNPMIQNLDIPQDWALRNTYKRHFFRTNPIVGAAIELHSEFPLSPFRICHDDEAVEEFLNDMLEEANFTELLLMAGMEWWLIGEFTMFSFFDDTDNPSCYTGFALLDPNKIQIASSNFVQGHQKETVHLSPDETLRKIIEKGPNDGLTGDIYRKLPSDIVAACKSQRSLPLSPLQVGRMKRGGYFNLRGDSCLERVFPLLMLKDELRTMQRAVAKRAINPIELWKIGETGDPADGAEIDAFREILQSTFYDVNAALIWHHAIQCQVIGSEGRMPVLWPEFDAIDNETCAGLLINKGLILGDSSTFASDVVRLDILVNRYMMFRTKVEKFIKQLLTPILKIHEIYVPESKVKSMRFREMCGKGRPLALPTIRWEKQDLRDAQAKMELMTKLVEKGLIPESMLIQMLNIDPKTAAEKVDQERLDKIERYDNLRKKITAKNIAVTPEIQQMLGMGQQAAPGGEPGGLPGGFGGGGGDDGGAPKPADLGGGGDLPDAGPGGPTGGATAGIPKPPGVQGAPSESHQPSGLPS